MKHTSIAGFALLAGALPAFAAGDVKDAMPRYERSGAGFSCHMTKSDDEISEAEDRDVCLRIGPFHTKSSRAEIEKLTGKPVTSAATKNGKAFAYMLQADKSGTMITYLVATYSNNDTVTTLQLTGAPWRGDWQFVGLTLGTPEKQVEDRLGPPLQIDSSDDPGAKLWSYAPWTFSFEIKGGVVSSIRISE